MAATMAATPLDLDFVVLDVQDDFPDDNVLPTQASTGTPGLGLLQASTSSGSDASAETPPPKYLEFEVSIDKGSSSSIGLDVDKADGKTILVILVKPGPVEDYNQQALGEKVAKGDRIISVNGVQGSIPEMLAALTSNQCVTFKLKRVLEFYMTIHKSAANEKLGIDVDHAAGEYLKVVSVGKLAKGDEVKVRSADLKMRLSGTGVNSEGKTGNIQEVCKQRGWVTFQLDDHKETVPMTWLEKSERCHGPVERYNSKQQAGSDVRLKEEDQIFEVNGVSAAGGKARDLLQVIAGSERLTLLVKRNQSSLGVSGPMVAMGAGGGSSQKPFQPASVAAADHIPDDGTS